MANTDEARRVLVRARVMVAAAEESLVYALLDNNKRFRLLWKLGFELHQMLEEYRIPGEVHGEKKEG